MKHKQKISWFLSGVLAALLIANLSAPVLAAVASKLIEVSPNVEIYVDGVKMEPTDVNGNPVDTFIYNGTTYVPLRAVSQYLGKSVDWDGANRRVYIGEAPGQKQYLLDVCPPYQTSYYSQPTSFKMAGVTYTNGFRIQDGGYALFNLNGRYDTLSFTLGHDDSGNMTDAKFNIFLDGKLVEEIEVSCNELPKSYTIALNGALQLRIEKIASIRDIIIGDRYGFANLIVD